MMILSCDRQITLSKIGENCPYRAIPNQISTNCGDLYMGNLRPSARVNVQEHFKNNTSAMLKTLFVCVGSVIRTLISL